MEGNFVQIKYNGLETQTFITTTTTLIRLMTITNKPRNLCKTTFQTYSDRPCRVSPLCDSLHFDVQPILKFPFYQNYTKCSRCKQIGVHYCSRLKNSPEYNVVLYSQTFFITSYFLPLPVIIYKFGTIRVHTNQLLKNCAIYLHLHLQCRALLLLTASL